MKGRDPSDLPRKDQMYRSAGTITTKSTFLSGRGMGVADWVLTPKTFLNFQTVDSSFWQGPVSRESEKEETAAPDTPSSQRTVSQHLDPTARERAAVPATVTS